MSAHPQPSPAPATSDSRGVLVGFDGSRQAAQAIGIVAQLLPDRTCRIANLWWPPYFDADIRARLWPRDGNMDDFQAAVEHEGQAEAERLVTEGLALAESAGWRGEGLLRRCYGDPGFELARLAQQEHADLVVVGSRGLSGVRAMLGSTSDGLVHYSPVPALVVPYPLLERERRAAASGPVLVASDGSPGAAKAFGATQSLFPGRKIEVAAVGFDEGDAGLNQPGATHLKPEGVLSSGRAIAEALAHHAQEIEASMIVVGSRGRAVHRELLLGSAAMAVLHHGHRPVLVVPNPENRSSGS